MRKLDRNRPRDGLTNPVISDCQMIHNFHKCILMKTSVFPPARTVVCSQHDSVFPDCFLGMANTRSRRNWKTRRTSFVCGKHGAILCVCRLTRRHNTLSCNGLQSASELIQIVFTRSHFRSQPPL
jgi:hypothetical protein